VLRDSHPSFQLVAISCSEKPDEKPSQFSTREES
jgi:hypothetical protein